jgi:membrane fusion protein, multidrug efflux system
MTNRKTLLAWALAPALALAPSARAAEPAATAAPARVRAAAAGAPAGGRFAPATVAAARRATVSTRLAASVAAVHVQEGQRVRAGQLLVSLSGDDVRGGLAAAEAAHDAAALHERRIETLLAAHPPTPAELDLARAQRAQADAAVASARTSLGYTELRAPFDGTVQARRVDPGDLVGPGQPVVELQGDALELQASLAEEEAAGLAVGQPVRFEADGVRGTAEITALTPGGDPLSHRRGLRARVRDFEGPLRAGAFARLALPGTAPSRGAVWVPRGALVERGDLTGVFVAVNGRAQLRWLSLGEPVGDAVPVRAGLRPGEVVIDAPGALRDGQAVEVAP